MSVRQAARTRGGNSHCGAASTASEQVLEQSSRLHYDCKSFALAIREFSLMSIAQQGNSVPIRKPLTWLVVSSALLLAACGGGGSSATNASVPAEAELSAQAALGEKIFADTSLSASGHQACASCHSPDNAHSPANSLVTQLGNALLDLQGRRSTPALNDRYFTEGALRRPCRSSRAPPS